MEILFKSKRLDTSELVEGWLSYCGEIAYILPKNAKTFIEIAQVRPSTICQFIGITDSEDIKIFSDDLRITEDGIIFRIYSVPGGFVIKAQHWMSDINDLIQTDELILSPIADPQTKNWLISSTKHFGNIHEKTSS